MNRKATRKEQIEIIQAAVETAIMQASAISGLRNWMIYHHSKNLKPGEWPNGESIVQWEGQSLCDAFEHIIDPDDKEKLTDHRTGAETAPDAFPGPARGLLAGRLDRPAGPG
jgi:hypothetical protein